MVLVEVWGSVGETVSVDVGWVVGGGGVVGDGTEVIVSVGSGSSVPVGVSLGKEGGDGVDVGELGVEEIVGVLLRTGVDVGVDVPPGGSETVMTN